MPPGRQTGKYQQQLNGVLPGPGPVVWDRIPTTLRSTSARSKTYVPFAAVWELMCDDIQRGPDMLDAPS
eukprot:4364086-Pyramimonas_sp.AAC.1